MLGLVGESGSGKSVTAMSIMRLLDDGWRTGGAVLLGGQDLLAMTEREMLDVRGKRIGMIFQDPANYDSIRLPRWGPRSSKPWTIVTTMPGEVGS